VDNVATALVEGAHAFLKHHWGDAERLSVLEGRTAGESLLSHAASEGWFNLAVPESAGGMGVHQRDLISLFQVFGQRLLVAPMFERMVLPGLLISASLPEAVKARLQRVANGEAALALIDPGVSLDWKVGEIQERDAVLNGKFALVRFARNDADFLVVALDSNQQEALLYVYAGTAGLAMEEAPSADPGVRFADLELNQVVATALARGAEAARLLQDIRAWARMLAAAELTGIARHALDLSLAYIVERKQFGTPIATFQAVRHLAASATQKVVELESVVESMATDQPDHIDSTLELAAMSYKALAAELARSIVEDSIQMHGGIGFTYEYELQWYYKRVLGLRAWYGDEIELYRAIGEKRLAR
jgi:alkylation response protein AidB-like acyl-CoA dehydrogenase